MPTFSGVSRETPMRRSGGRDLHAVDEHEIRAHAHEPIVGCQERAEVHVQHRQVGASARPQVPLVGDAQCARRPERVGTERLDGGQGLRRAPVVTRVTREAAMDGREEARAMD